MNIRIHIERLVLDGVAAEPELAASVRAGLEAELVRLLAAEDVPALLHAGDAVPVLRPPPVPLAPDLPPGRLGAQVARAVHASLGS